jgi:SAM-dependent MidA family methyltransferase
MAEALYGEDGFFRSRAAPADHFRTSAHTGSLFASAIARVVTAVDRALGQPATLDVVDVGAGRGELLTALGALLEPELSARVRMTAVELAPRPDDLPSWIAWQERLPDALTGLLFASEWLDNVPVDVVTIDDDGNWRNVLVDQAGVESIGAMPSDEDAAWLSRWWPDGHRAEVGRTRDAAWADAVSRVTRGLALTIDYGHVLPGRPPLGTLAAYRDGREVQPVPDGSCDLTAHVAMDAAASAVAEPALLVRQSDALHALGVSGQRPPLALAQRDPGGYIRALADASVAAELTDPTGLGGHYWLWHPIGVDLDELLKPTMTT